MRKKIPIFYSALMLTGVNLLLRMVGTSFQVYISGRIGAAGVGLLQLVMSVGILASTAGMAGIRTATMYLTAEELGKKRPGNITWVLSGCVLYSLICSLTVSLILYCFAPALAQHWIGDMCTVSALRLYACFLPVSCLCGVMTGYFTAANRIGTLAAVEVSEQLFSMTATMSLLTFWADSDASKACQAVVFGSGLGACLTLACLMIFRLKEQAAVNRPISVRGRLLKTAAPLALADDLKSGISTIENLMVPKRLSLYVHSENPLAVFGIISGMVFPVLMFPAAILFGLAELLIPEFARCSAAGSQVRIQYLTKRSLRVALLYGCLFSGIMFLTSQELCDTLYKNTQAGAYLQWFSLLIPMLYCDAITDAITKGLGQQTTCVRYNIITSFLDVVFLYLLLPRFGIAGYYFSFLVTHLLNFALSLRRLLKITGRILTSHIPILAIISTIGSICASSFVHHPIGKAGCFMLIFASLLCLLGVVKMEDFRWVWSLICRQKFVDKSSSR